MTSDGYILGGVGASVLLLLALGVRRNELDCLSVEYDLTTKMFNTIVRFDHLLAQQKSAYRFQKILHDLVSVVVVRVGEEENFGSVGAQSSEQDGQTVVALNEFCEILDSQSLKIPLRAPQQDVK